LVLAANIRFTAATRRDPQGSMKFAHQRVTFPKRYIHKIRKRTTKGQCQSLPARMSHDNTSTAVPIIMKPRCVIVHFLAARYRCKPSLDDRLPKQSKTNRRREKSNS
jgi:hypothetical protein